MVLHMFLWTEMHKKKKERMKKQKKNNNKKQTNKTGFKD